MDCQHICRHEGQLTVMLFVMPIQDIEEFLEIAHQASMSRTDDVEDDLRCQVCMRSTCIVISSNETMYQAAHFA